MSGVHLEPETFSSSSSSPWSDGRYNRRRKSWGRRCTLCVCVCAGARARAFASAPSGGKRGLGKKREWERDGESVGGVHGRRGRGWSLWREGYEDLDKEYPRVVEGALATPCLSGPCRGSWFLVSQAPGSRFQQCAELLPPATTHLAVNMLSTSPWFEHRPPIPPAPPPVSSPWNATRISGVCHETFVRIAESRVFPVLE